MNTSTLQRLHEEWRGEISETEPARLTGRAHMKRPTRIESPRRETLLPSNACKRLHENKKKLSGRVSPILL